ncbi:hypothetical protein VTK56DRAFT_7218 [Thermocarpiscus australiensis]
MQRFASPDKSDYRWEAASPRVPKDRKCSQGHGPRVRPTYAQPGSNGHHELTEVDKRYAVRQSQLVPRCMRLGHRKLRRKLSCLQEDRQTYKTLSWAGNLTRSLR